ncbi:MAG: hypothetical protein HZB51_34380 [Chloroflexi bacterium]|nr:hypothetical protein [Chloroflexota bacterium]
MIQKISHATVRILARILEVAMTPVAYLAIGWLNLHLAVRMINAPQFVNFKRIEATPDGMKLLIESPAVLTLAEQAAHILNHYNAQNFVQMALMPHLATGLKPIEFTIRWQDGMMPAEKCAMLEKQLEEERASRINSAKAWNYEIAHLRGDVAQERFKRQDAVTKGVNLSERIIASLWAEHYRYHQQIQKLQEPDIPMDDFMRLKIDQFRVELDDLMKSAGAA